MPIPLIKAALTGLRYALRPINNMIIRKFKSFEKDSPSYKFFVEFGQKSNRFEIKLNRVLLGTKSLVQIQNIHDSIAFTKGVEWFTEIFLFYGVLFLITWYELHKMSRKSAETKK